MNCEEKNKFFLNTKKKHQKVRVSVRNTVGLAKFGLTVEEAGEKVYSLVGCAKDERTVGLG